MYLKYIYLRNFRNFAEAEFAFKPYCNVIHGENGQGKTNLLEAIILLSIGRSFRTQHLSELIREKESSFYIEAELFRDHITHQIKLSFDGQNKRLQINANIHSHFSPLLGLIPSVLYAPQVAELISGSPILRRRFLDLHLVQSDPLYVHHLSRFYRAMKQRNCLLRSHNLEAISCWEVEMVQAASYMQQERKNLVDSLQPLLLKEAQFLSRDTEAHQISFHPSYQSHDYIEQLQKHRKRDQELKHTTTGPHRDDLAFTIDHKPARSHASEGQKKTTLAALKLSEWRRLAGRVDASPLMAIDDLGQPLDGKREELFCHTLGTLGQVVITTPKILSINDLTHFIEIKKH